MRFQLFGTNGCYNGANGHKCGTKYKKPAPYTHRSGEIYHQALSIKKHYILASLVKGEVLSPEKNSGDYRRDYFTPTEPLYSHNLLKITSTVSPRTMPLPPLSKGGGLTARHKLLLCCVLLATRPPFLFTKLFCRQDGGIASPPSLACTNPPKPALSPALHHILTPLAKGELLLLSFAQPTIEDSSHQHRRKHFAYWQGVNNFVSVSVQLH